LPADPKAAAPEVPDVSPAAPSPGWRALLALLGQLPQPGMSRAFGRLADLRIPTPMRRPMLRAFARAVGIDLDEVELPLGSYASLNAFFVRRLRDGAREWPHDPDIVASPVDGVVGAFGRVHDGELLQAKGRRYTAVGLLDDEAAAVRYRDGSFITLYLSPRHYHRIHAPTDGMVVEARHVPGALLPVNQHAISHVDQLFPRNERVICHVDGPAGRMAIVAIGAYNVGRISTAFAPSWGGIDGSGWVSNRKGAKSETRRWDPPPSVAQGDEIMAFHLGSTVVLLLEAGQARIGDDVAQGREVRCGDPIALRRSEA
jgi:phosphatidylserine decarboxylase